MKLLDHEIYVYKLFKHMKRGATAKDLANVTNSSPNDALEKLWLSFDRGMLIAEFGFRGDDYVKEFRPTAKLIKLMIN